MLKGASAESTSMLRSLGIAFLLVVTCIIYVPTRGELGGSALRGDALYYAAMVSGSSHEPEPYRFRLIVPWLARALPWRADVSLAVVSWASLLLTYTLVLESARRLELARTAATVGLAAAAFTAPHLYLYFNPYLTDAAGLLMVALAVEALLARRYLLFTAACTLGVGIRESVLVMAPSWSATRQWKKAAGSLAFSLAAFLSIRWLVGPSGLPEKGPFVFPARSLGATARDALAAWHGLWLVAPVGLALVRVSRRELLFLATFLFGGAVATSLLASDTTRMFQPLFPVIALGLAAFIQQLWRHARAAVVALLATCFVTSVVWQPVRFMALTPGSPLELRLHTLAFAVLAVTSVLATAILLFQHRRAAAGWLERERE